MKNLLNKLTTVSTGILLSLSPSLSFAIEKGSPQDLPDGVTTVTDYLKYAMYGATVIGLLGVAFLLFAQHQEQVLKSIVRVIVIVCVVALVFTIPTWFSLCIPATITVPAM